MATPDFALIAASHNWPCNSPGFFFLVTEPRDAGRKKPLGMVGITIPTVASNCHVHRGERAGNSKIAHPFRCLSRKKARGNNVATGSAYNQRVRSVEANDGLVQINRYSTRTMLLEFDTGD